MLLRVDLAWLIGTLLLSTRIAAAIAIAPVLGTTRVPAVARVFFTFAISGLMIAEMKLPTLATTSLLNLVVSMFAEAFIGLTFAFGFVAAYGATQMAGRAMDTQIGFGAAAVFNPATLTVAPLLGNLLGMVTIGAFLALNGHLVLFKTLAVSLQSMPPGTIGFQQNWMALLEYSGITFGFALALAAPVMFTLLLSDIAMAVFARSMPQLNVFVLGFAVKLILGLLGLATSIRVAEALLGDMLGKVFGFWDQVATGI